MAGVVKRVKYIGPTCYSLTNGKVYDVMRIDGGWYRIIDNSDEDYLFDPSEFEVVE